jgi:hypothetical protein
MHGSGRVQVSISVKARRSCALVLSNVRRLGVTACAVPDLERPEQGRHSGQRRFRQPQLALR